MPEEIYGNNAAGSLTIAGGANITISQSGNSITIVGATNSGATTFLAGVSSGGNTLGTTGVINNQIVLVGGNNVTLSQSKNAQSATVTMSVSNESNTFGMSNLGNTFGTSGVASGSQVRFLFAGGSNVSLSQSVNGASGTITINGSWTTGAQSFGVRSQGNTAGTTGYVTGNLLEYDFIGGSNITLSQSINGSSGTLTIIGPAQTTGGQSIGMLSDGNTSGTSGYASGYLVNYDFVGTQNITLSQSINGASGTLTISGMIPGEAIQPVASAASTGSQTQFYAAADHRHPGVFSAGVSTGGNTAGSTAVLPGKFVLVGGNHITLSMSTDASNGMTVSIIGV